MRKLFIPVLFSLVLLGTSCKKEKEVEDEVKKPVADPTLDLNSYLSQMSPVDNPMPLNSPEPVGVPLVEWSGTTYCTTTKYKLGPEYSEGFLLNPATDVIYPGAILDGNSINDGGYRLISLPRTGGVISTDNINAKTASKTIDETVKSKIQQGIIDILNEEGGGEGSVAQINFEIKDIYSAQQVDMELGFSMGISSKNKIKSGFDFSKGQTKSRVMVKFQQIYYTMTYDAKGRPADYFQSGVRSTDVYNSINGTSIAPVYVSNVKYGRLALCSFESDMAQKDLQSTLNAVFSALKVSGSLDVEYKKALSENNTTIKGTILGGSGEDAVQTIEGVEGLYNYIKGGGTFSASSPGTPIAYTLRRITDNGVFNVVNISEYVVNDCYNTTGAVMLNSIRHIEGGQDDKLSGTVKINLGYTGEGFANASTTLWIQGGSFITIPTNGATIPLSNNSLYRLVYDPKKFDKAFIEITVDLINRHYWSTTVYKKSYDGNLDVAIYKTYKVYLKDIAKNELGGDWSMNNSSAIDGSRTYDLNVLSPKGEDLEIPYTTCDSPLQCTPKVRIDSKAASRMYFNFSLNVESDLD